MADLPPASQPTAMRPPAAPNPVARGLRWIFRAIRNYFAVIGALVTLLVLMLASELTKVGKTKVDLDLKDGTVLAFELDGKIAERAPAFEERIFRRFFGGESEIYLPQIRAALKAAALDPKVAVVNARFGALRASPAEYGELRRILGEFRASGKKVMANLEEADDWNYYVASVADRITLTPATSVSINGPTFHLIYFGDALKKLGVDIDVVRAGKYKSAFEPFVENAPTPATLEEYGSMQRSLLAHVVAAVAEGRGRDPAEVAGWFKRSVFTANDAVRMGLVDELGYETLADDWKDRVTVAKYGKYAESTHPGQDSVEGQGGIGLIEAVGEISMAKKADVSNEDGITPDAMRDAIRWAKDDDDVKAVVMRVSSPGGSAVASDIIWHELKELAAKKPLVVSMGAYAASGGYYISAPAKYIVAEPTTITGSIGVIGMLPSFGPFKEKYGVSFHVVTGSDRAALLNMGQRATPEDRALVDATIAEVYQTFIDKVAEGRGIDPMVVADLAQGRVYTGVEAKELKLVDELGGRQAAFDKAKELAGFDKTKLYPVLKYEGDHTNWRECLKDPAKMMKCFDDADTRVGRIVRAHVAAPSAALPERVAARVQQWLSPESREGPLALWPGYLSVSF